MLATTTKAVKHFDKWVPCFHGRAIAYASSPAKLVRVGTESEAKDIANLYELDLSAGHPRASSYLLGDNYMLSQHPITE